MNFLRVWSVFVTISLTLSCGSSMPGTQQNGAGSSNPPAGGNSSIVISSTSPTSIAAGSPDFTITIIGTGFPSEPLDSKDHPAVFWQPSSNHQDGTYLSVDNLHSAATHVTATVPSSLVGNADTVKLQVQIFFFADDTPKSVSNLITFEVTN